jgi:hypothetical protein
LLEISALIAVGRKSPQPLHTDLEKQLAKLGRRFGVLSIVLVLKFIRARNGKAHTPFFYQRGRWVPVCGALTDILQNIDPLKMKGCCFEVPHRGFSGFNGSPATERDEFPGNLHAGLTDIFLVKYYFAFVLVDSLGPYASKLFAPTNNFHYIERFLEYHVAIDGRFGSLDEYLAPIAKARSPKDSMKIACRLISPRLFQILKIWIACSPGPLIFYNSKDAKISKFALLVDQMENVFVKSDPNQRNYYGSLGEEQAVSQFKYMAGI